MKRATCKGDRRSHLLTSTATSNPNRMAHKAKYIQPSHNFAEMEEGPQTEAEQNKQQEQDDELHLSVVYL